MKIGFLKDNDDEGHEPIAELAEEIMVTTFLAIQSAGLCQSCFAMAMIQMYLAEWLDNSFDSADEATQWLAKEFTPQFSAVYEQARNKHDGVRVKVH